MQLPPNLEAAGGPSWVMRIFLLTVGMVFVWWLIHRGPKS